MNHKSVQFDIVPRLPKDLQVRVSTVTEENEQEVLDEVFDFLLKAVKYGESTTSNETNGEEVGYGQMARYVSEKTKDKGKGVLLYHFESIFCKEGCNLKNSAAMYFSVHEAKKKLRVRDPYIFGMIKGYDPKDHWVLLITVVKNGEPVMTSYRLTLEAEKNIEHPLGEGDPTLAVATECSKPGCTKKNMSLKMCGRCKVAAYCSRDCQVAHWKQGHKGECAKLVQKQKKATTIDVKHAKTPNQTAQLKENSAPCPSTDLIKMKTVEVSDTFEDSWILVDAPMAR